MYVSYDDILKRIPEPPLWWSDGVPRYEPFEPKMTDVYAGEALLIEAKCQHCSRSFVLGIHSVINGPGYRREIEEANDIHLDDPPSHDCDGPGNSMSSVPVRVLEFWENLGGQDWRRVPELERLLATS
jgi:hypothetical protein